MKELLDIEKKTQEYAFCIYCGKKHTKSARFCPACGKKIPEIVHQSGQESLRTEQETVQAKQESKATQPRQKPETAQAMQESGAERLKQEPQPMQPNQKPEAVQAMQQKTQPGPNPEAAHPGQKPEAVQPSQASADSVHKPIQPSQASAHPGQEPIRPSQEQPAPEPARQADSGQPATTSSSDAPSFGIALLCFFIPVVGLVLYLVWKEEKPLRAGSAGRGALFGLIAYVALSIISAAVPALYLGRILSYYL